MGRRKRLGKRPGKRRPRKQRGRRRRRRKRKRHARRPNAKPREHERRPKRLPPKRARSALDPKTTTIPHLRRQRWRQQRQPQRQQQRVWWVPNPLLWRRRDHLPSDPNLFLSIP